MTYEQRYAPYTDEALGITYLRPYKRWTAANYDRDSRHPREDQDGAAVKLSDVNERAIDPSGYPAWRDLIDDCQRVRPVDEARRTAFLLRVHENYTWVRPPAA